MKIGVLGCGMIAELGHLPALRDASGLSLHGVFDVNWDRALAMQKNLVSLMLIQVKKTFGIPTSTRS